MITSPPLVRRQLLYPLTQITSSLVTSHQTNQGTLLSGVFTQLPGKILHCAADTCPYLCLGVYPFSRPFLLAERPEFSTVQKARFCISDSEKWDLIPLSTFFNATIDADNVGDKEILILPTCCGSLVKYLMVASGRASVFIVRTKQQTTEQRNIKAWDLAVGQICVHDAGGRVTDWRGSQLNYAEDKAERCNVFPSDGVLVTNGSVHDQIIKMISSYVPV